MASRREYQMDFLLNAQLNGNFKNSTSKAAQEFARLGSEIQQLNKLQSDIASYTKQQSAVEKTKEKLENLQKQHDLLQREIDETGDSTGRLEREKLKLEQRINSTNESLQNQQARLDATGQALTDAGVDTSNLTQETDRLTQEIHDLTAEQEDAANQSATLGESFSQAMTDMGNAVDALGLMDFFNDLAAAYEACINLAAELEATMSTVEAISGATQNEMDDLTAKAKEMGATTKFTAVEAGEAFNYMARHTWPTVRKRAA